MATPSSRTASIARQSGPRLNTLLTTAGTVGSLVATFAMRLVIARLYGPQPLGLYSVAIAFHRVSAQLADAGLHYALLRRGLADPELARAGVALKMTLGLIVAVVSASVAALVVTGDTRLALVAGSLGAFGWSQLDAAELWFRLHGRFKADFAVHLATSVMRVGIATLVQLWTGQIALTLVAYFLVPAFAGFFVPWPWARPAVPFDILRASFWSFSYRTIWLLLLNIDVFVIPAITDVTTLGRYEAPRSVAYAILALADGAFVAILQRVGAGRDDAVGAAESITKITLLAVLATPLAGAVAYVALPLVFGPSFASLELAIVFALLSVGYLAASGASSYASVVLFSRPKWLTGVLVLETVIAAVAFAAGATRSLIVVAAAVAVVHVVNLVVLRSAVKRALPVTNH